MKRTSKKRKLEYIRSKNRYRRGGKALCFFKIANELKDDLVFVERLTWEQRAETINTLERKFKLKFELVGMDSGMDGEDFINSLTTIMLIFKVVRL